MPSASQPEQVPTPPASSSPATPTDDKPGAAPYRLVARLVAKDGALLDAFGSSMAIGDDVLAIASPYRKDRIGRGVVHIFQREGDTFTEVQRLRNPRNFSLSGETVAFVGGRLLVSRRMPFKEEPPAWFRREGSTWTADGYEPRPPGNISHFGSLVAVSGEEVILPSRGSYATPGRFHAYVLNGEKTSARDAVWCGDCWGMNYYPSSIGLDGDLMVAAVKLDPGAELIFVRGRTSPKPEHVVAGYAWAEVAVRGETVVATTTELTHVFRRDAAWKVVQALPPAGGVVFHGRDLVLSTGAVLRESGGKFVEVEQLRDGDGKAFLMREEPVVAQGGRYVAIARPTERGRGAVYVFERGSP